MMIWWSSIAATSLWPMRPASPCHLESSSTAPAQWNIPELHGGVELGKSTIKGTAGICSIAKVYLKGYLELSVFKVPQINSSKSDKGSPMSVFWTRRRRARIASGFQIKIADACGWSFFDQLLIPEVYSPGCKFVTKPSCFPGEVSHHLLLLNGWHSLYLGQRCQSTSLSTCPMVFHVIHPIVGNVSPLKWPDIGHQRSQTKGLPPRAPPGAYSS